MKDARIIYDKDYVIGEVDKRLFGSFVEHLGRCMYGGIYEPEHDSADENGFREDVKQLIRELGVTGIRYPGGNFVSGYNWKDGVGPKKERPRRKELAWNTIETNEIGTNEFAALLKELKLNLMMAVNLGTGTPKEAGELVEYCNIPEGTYWSDKRREHGVKEPHNIKMWCLGNEMDGEWQICMRTAEEYARLCKETAKIVKWIDPASETIACGSCTNELGHKSFGVWDQAVLEECYDYIDYLSLHRYFNYNPGKQLAYKMHDTEADIPFFFKDLKNYLDTVISACDYVKGKRHSEKTINISFDEWGVITETGAIPGGVKQEYKYASFKQMDAMIYGGILCTFLNYADRVKIACQSLLVNEGGMITTDPAGKAIRQTIFYSFQDVARYAKGKVLRAAASFPVKMTEHHGEQECLTAAGTYDEKSGEITIFAANSDMESDIRLSLELRSFGEVIPIGWRELYDDDPYAENTFENEFRVVPRDEEMPEMDDGKFTVVLKKHSWNVFRFGCSGMLVP